MSGTPFAGRLSVRGLRVEMNRLQQLARLEAALRRLRVLRDWIFESAGEEGAWTKELDEIITLIEEA